MVYIMNSPDRQQPNYALINEYITSCEAWNRLIFDVNVNDRELDALREHLEVIRGRMTEREYQIAVDTQNANIRESIRENSPEHRNEIDTFNAITPERNRENRNQLEPNTEPESIAPYVNMINEYLALEKEANRMKRSSDWSDSHRIISRIQELREILTQPELLIVENALRERSRELRTIERDEPQPEPPTDSEEEPEEERDPNVVRNLIPDVFNARHVQRYGIIPHSTT